MMNLLNKIKRKEPMIRISQVSSVLKVGKDESNMVIQESAVLVSVNYDMWSHLHKINFFKHWE